MKGVVAGGALALMFAVAVPARAAESRREAQRGPPFGRGAQREAPQHGIFDRTVQVPIVPGKERSAQRVPFEFPGTDKPVRPEHLAHLDRHSHPFTVGQGNVELACARLLPKRRLFARDEGAVGASARRAAVRDSCRPTVLPLGSRQSRPTRSA